MSIIFSCNLARIGNHQCFSNQQYPLLQSTPMLKLKPLEKSLVHFCIYMYNVPQSKSNEVIQILYTSLLRLLPLLTIVVDCLMDSAYDYLFVDGSIAYNDCLEITAKCLVLIRLCSFLLCSKVVLLCVGISTL